MTLGIRGVEKNRGLVGFIILLAGLLALVWVWGNWTYRAARIPPGASPPPITAPHEQTSDAAPVTDDRANAALADSQAQRDPTSVKAAMAFLGGGAVLFILLVSGTYAIARSARRRRAILEHKPEPTQQTSDVWSMHKLPDELADDPSPEDSH